MDCVLHWQIERGSVPKTMNVIVVFLFQELAILHDTNRQSTVISRELIELLCISKEVTTKSIIFFVSVFSRHVFLSRSQFINNLVLDILKFRKF